MIKQGIAALFSLVVLASCGDGLPSCDDKQVMDKLKSLIAGTVVSRLKDLSCSGGCRPYLDGENIQFHTLAIRGATKNNNGSTSGNLIAKLTFQVSRADFLNAINLTAKNVRVIAKDADAKRTSCAADFSVAFDLGAFKAKLPSEEIIEFEGFDGNVGGWSRTQQGRTTAMKELESTYKSMFWMNPISYNVQLTTDGNLYVTTGR